MVDWHRNVARRDGQELSYFEVGPQGAPTLLFCHGLAANAEQFHSDALYFSNRGYRIVAPDLRGHGKSPLTVPLDRGDFSISGLALDLLAVLDHADVPSVSYIGNSLGGILGLELMRDHADRLERFASFGTAYALDVPALAIRILPVLHRLLGQKLVAYIGAKSTSNKRDTQEFVRHMFLSSNPDVVTRILAGLGHYDLIKPAIAFGKPILMLRGAHDGSINSKLGPTLDAMQPLANFQLVDVANAGHCANLDAPEKVRREILHFVEASERRGAR